MNKRFSYTIPQMTRRLLRIAAPVKGLLIISTLASILGNLAQIGLCPRVHCCFWPARS